jgi:hypothetical protein
MMVVDDYIIINLIIEYFDSFVDLVYSSLVEEVLMEVQLFYLIVVKMKYFVDYYVADVVEVECE